MSQKRKSPRAPFLVTVTGATALLLGPACNGFVTTNPPMPTPKCPATLPAPGSACEQEGDFCGYEDACERSASANCSNFEGKIAWTVKGFSGPCSTAACPDDVPVHGEACDPEGLSCEYSVDYGCGPEPVTAGCTDAAWLVVWQGATCNPPPPPPPPCFLLQSETDCGTNFSCRWLEPGCGENPLPKAICRPVEACTGDFDCSSGTCQEASVLPECAKQGLCDSCGEQLVTCVP